MKRPAILLVLALTAIALPVHAHEFRPAILDLEDLGEGRAAVTWIASGDADGAPLAARLSPPPDCRLDPTTARRVVITCPPPGLGGRALTLRGLGGPHGDALVRYTGPAGPITTVLRADSPTFTIPAEAAPAPALTRARGYFSAGIGHILAGIDHLLFVLGLLFLVRGPAALARTITAFTLAHSVTLALAVTAAVRLPPAPVEAAIALSLVLLAAEIARGEARPPTLARAHPALLAFVFGLLHGFGFAGGLGALRVPQSDLPFALLGFNLGIEAGQLAFVAVALGLAALLRLRRSPAPARITAYAMGALGAFFTLQRLSAFWSS